MDSYRPTKRIRIVLRAAFIVVFAMLYGKVCVDILNEYVGYFPPDFKNAAFLIGREDSFRGVYPCAFYAHIILGPAALWLGTFQYCSANRHDLLSLHRRLGPVQTVAVLVTGSSGLVMAAQAHAGPIAGFGFALHSLGTMGTVVVAAYYASRREWPRHRVWARRCLLLLLAPLLLRLMTGFTIVTHLDTPNAYRCIAWLSWMLPMGVHELCYERVGRILNSSKPSLSLPSQF